MCDIHPDASEPVLTLLEGVRLKTSRHPSGQAREIAHVAARPGIHVSLRKRVTAVIHTEINAHLNAFYMEFRSTLVPKVRNF